MPVDVPLLPCFVCPVRLVRLCVLWVCVAGWLVSCVSCEAVSPCACLCVVLLALLSGVSCAHVRLCSCLRLCSLVSCMVCLVCLFVLRSCSCSCSISFIVCQRLTPPPLARSRCSSLTCRPFQVSVVIRSLQLTQKRVSLEFKALDGVIR